MIIIAHRGAPAEAVENTRSSFLAALRSGAHMLETDLHVTRDGHLVVHHDPGTRRLLGVRKIIAQEPLARLLLLRYANGDGLLTLEDLLKLVGARLPINLELKAPGTAAHLITYLREQPYPGKILISSPRIEELRYVMNDRLDAPLGPVVDSLNTASWRQLQTGTFQFVSLNRKAFSVDTLRKLHNLALKVYLYTVNDPADMRQFASAGVDGIFTDNPAAAVHVLASDGSNLPSGEV
jgi:glycerophosphoryl diester phosphodiesterase